MSPIAYRLYSFVWFTTSYRLLNPLPRTRIFLGLNYNPILAGSEMVLDTFKKGDLFELEGE